MSVNTKAFKTRTIMKERKNKTVEGFWPIAIDIGYSSVKGFSPNAVYAFPSYARRMNFAMINGIEAKDEEILYKNEKGDVWIVGASAQKMISTSDTNDSLSSLYGRHRYNSEMFLVIARVGLALGMMDNTYGKIKETDALRVQTGLPPAYMKSDTQWLKESLTGKHDFQVKVGKRPWVRFTFELANNHIDVMPQPMGTLYSIATDNNGNFTAEADKYFTSNVLIFDPGFGTLDIFSVKNKGVDFAETFEDLGMKRVLEETSKGIFDEYQTEIPVPSMQEALGAGVFKYKNIRKRESSFKPFNDILEKNSKKVCKEALGKLDDISNYLTEHDYLVVTGGTGAAWAEYINDCYKGMETLTIVAGNQNDDLPYIFSNVRGYYMFLIMNLQRISRFKNREG